MAPIFAAGAPAAAESLLGPATVHDGLESAGQSHSGGGGDYSTTYRDIVKSKSQNQERGNEMTQLM